MSLGLFFILCRHSQIAVASFGDIHSECGRKPAGFTRLTPDVLNWVKSTSGIYHPGITKPGEIQECYKTTDFFIFISSRAHHWRWWCRRKAVCGDFSPWLWFWIFLLPSAFSWISQSSYTRWFLKMRRYGDSQILPDMEFWHRFLGPGYWFTDSG